MKRLAFFLIIASGFLLWESRLFAQFWTATSLPTNLWWDSVASSADGNRLVAVAMNTNTPYGAFAIPIWISTNQGSTWVTTSSVSNFWSSVASSADGTTLVAATQFGVVYTSHDSGATWNSNSLPAYNLPSGSLANISLASSADGTKLVATTGFSGIYTSTNSGATWTQSSNVSAYYWTSVAASADGTKLVAGSFGGIYASTDSGTTWTLCSNAPTKDSGYSVASSADGATLVAGNSDNVVYISTNSGATWTASNTPLTNSTLSDVNLSADGTKIFACALQPDTVFISTNLGESWTSSFQPNIPVDCIASSADGTKVVAAMSNNQGMVPYSGIFTLQPGPTLNIIHSDTNIVLSWPSYATGFGLQENSDLTTTNWTNVLLNPTVTNGQDQATLPLPGINVFYRLIASEGPYN